ncbi:MAG TPA: hypothetical protein VKM35_05060 [Arenimonas sp.]|uniref:hypothetical protein n=1 Tax=Arenimonas sp. TaxID=1872635 RepID=UPI002C8EF502|nr:hypothetical protein [Arenimonas sp.]HMB56560.1 hypothetical protein [Arenimonas sp.]
MSTSSFNKIAATVFGIVALAHAARLAMALPVQIGTLPVPVWVSWAGLIVAGALCIWGFRARS